MAAPQISLLFVGHLGWLKFETAKIMLNVSV